MWFVMCCLHTAEDHLPLLYPHEVPPAPAQEQGSAASSIVPIRGLLSTVDMQWGGAPTSARL